MKGCKTLIEEFSIPINDWLASKLHGQP
jgi:hypothetical protein